MKGLLGDCGDRNEKRGSAIGEEITDPRDDARAIPLNSS